METAKDYLFYLEVNKLKPKGSNLLHLSTTFILSLLYFVRSRQSQIRIFSYFVLHYCLSLVMLNIEIENYYNFL